MKKSHFIGLVWGAVALMLFALGMCMALLPEWQAFRQGIWCGCAGLLLGALDLLWLRKKAGKPPIHCSGKALGIGALTVCALLALGIGMCLSMLWGELIWGCAVGTLGILLLLGLIPLTKGLKE